MCPLSKNVDYTKLSGVVDCLGRRDGIQRVLDRLVESLSRSMGPRGILHLDWINLSNKHWMGDELIKSIPEEKDLECWWMKNWTFLIHVNALSKNPTCAGVTPQPGQPVLCLCSTVMRLDLCIPL